jgi:hypothetical protein
MAEQVLIKNVDLSWITITSEDAQVMIVRESLTKYLSNTLIFSAFEVKYGALPIISVLFNMDSSGVPDEKYGFYVSNNS